MAQVSLPYQLTAGQPENVNQLMDNLNTLRNGINTIDTAQLSDGAITADKLGATLAGQLGITTTATARSVTVTQTAEITNTALATVGTSSNLTVATGGLLRIVLSCELKNSGAGNTTFVQPEIDTGGGTWLALSTFGQGTTWTGSAYGSTLAGVSPVRAQVYGSTYKAVGWSVFLPSHLQTSSNLAAFRVRYEPNAGTAYLKNLTATMTYIAV